MSLAVLQFGWDQYPNSSATSHSELSSNATVGNTVALAIISTSGTLGDVASVSSSIGTFTRINDVNQNLDLEWWVCLSVTTSAKNLTVTTTSGDNWYAAAYEISGGATNATSGGSVSNSGSSGSLSITPVESGDLILAATQSSGASPITSEPSSPWTLLGGVGVWSESKGADAAYQVVPSTSSVAAAWSNSYGGTEILGLIVHAPVVATTEPIVMIV
ncbi:MAG TPA: hypothetical protein VMR95_01420 [Candidatus Binatia bacterium]|nr:hypothetical protein [Candidatus Binatia bacterium]